MAAVARYWRLVVGTCLAAVVLGGCLTLLQPRVYEAHSQLFVSTVKAGTANDLALGGSFAQNQVATYADIVTTPLVLEPVSQERGLESAAELEQSVTAVVPANTALIEVRAQASTAESAIELADAVAEQFSETIQDLEVTDEGESAVRATLVSPAQGSAQHASPQVGLTLVLAGLFGLFLGITLAVLKGLLATTVRGEQDARQVTDKALLGTVAFDKDAPEHPIVYSLDQHSPRAEAFRSLRTNLRYIDADNPPRTLVMTSTIPGEGKSTTTANLAMTMAASGAKVCLIEGDLRRPRLLEYLGLENAAGLTDVLVDRAELDDVMQPYFEGLDVLGCGPIPPNPSELLGSDSMARLLAKLESTYDAVLIDSPPLLAVTDAAVLSTLADGTVVVVGVGLVKRDQLAKALEKLHQVDADVLGLVLNRLPIKGPDAYSYAYETYAPDIQAKGRGKRKRSRASRKSKTLR